MYLVSLESLLIHLLDNAQICIGSHIISSDQTQNACHGSDSPESAEREAQFFFGADAQHKNTASLVDCSCCVIKPTAVKEGKENKKITKK